jgi:hypothetical protein
MSIKVMSAVFERYPNGGGEMLLALALADHASDDGGRIFPSIKHLAGKTRQAERSVQYQLRRMESDGWLILVNSGNGGRNQHREYQISLDWIKGAEIAPRKKGATDGAKGCNPRHERVQPVAPAYNHHGTITEPSLKKTIRQCVLPESFQPDATAESLAETLGVNVPGELAAFTDHHQANGSLFTDWQAAFRTWTRNAAKFAQRNKRNGPAAMTASKHNSAESFSERDARAKREAWELMSGRKWPEQDLPANARRDVIEAQTTPIRRIA